MKTSTKLYELELGFPILALELDFFFFKENKTMAKELRKMSFFLPKDIQRVISSQKISENETGGVL